MKTIVISDTALIGIDYQDTLEGLNYLKYRQNKGDKLIILSDKPEYYLHQVGIYVPLKTKTYYRSLDFLEGTNYGINYILYDNKILNTINITPNFIILGNGISILDSKNNSIYQGPFIEKSILENIIKTLKEHGYISYNDPIPLIDRINNNSNYTLNDLYKFYTPKTITTEINDQVYGIQCGSRKSYFNDLVIKEVEQKNPSIIGYTQNKSPCFYQREINKLTAFKNILENNKDIDIEKTVFILKDETDEILFKAYPELSYCLDSNFMKYKNINKSKSLVKMLNKAISN